MSKTLTFKPFCIKYEDWMTDEQVAEVFDKAVSCGAYLLEGVFGVHEEFGGTNTYKARHWMYFGINYEGDTYFADNLISFDRCVIRLDQVDSHLNLDSGVSGQLEQGGIMTNKITDLRNTAIKLGGMKSEDIRQYIIACESQCIDISAISDLVDAKYIECFRDKLFCVGDVGNLEMDTILINFTSNTTWEATVVEGTRATITLFGEEYYVDMIQPMLDSMAAAKVSSDGGITPKAGSGNPPDKKLV